jgi:hypothetical protein
MLHAIATQIEMHFTLSLMNKLRFTNPLTVFLQKYPPIDMAIDMGDISNIKSFDIEGILL